MLDSNSFLYFISLRDIIEIANNKAVIRTAATLTEILIIVVNGKALNQLLKIKI